MDEQRGSKGKLTFVKEVPCRIVPSGTMASVIKDVTGFKRPPDFREPKPHNVEPEEVSVSILQNEVPLTTAEVMKEMRAGKFTPAGPRTAIGLKDSMAIKQAVCLGIPGQNGDPRPIFPMAGSEMLGFEGKGVGARWERGTKFACFPAGAKPSCGRI